MPIQDDSKAYNEWILQSDYDYETAEAVFSTARYVYAVFMRHLSIEKVIKSQYVKRLNKVALKVIIWFGLLKKLKWNFPRTFTGLCSS